MASPANEYQPNYAVPPGETLREALAERDMTVETVAARSGLATVTVRRIVAGEAEITPDIASRLESALDIPGPFWLALEWDYRTALTRQAGPGAGVA